MEYVRRKQTGEERDCEKRRKRERGGGRERERDRE